MYVVNEPFVRGAAPTGRSRRCRCCSVAARSWLRPPTADCARRERSLRSYSSAPAATTEWPLRQMPQRRGFSETSRIVRWEVAARRARAQRGYERSTFSGSRKSSSDGQGRRCVGTAQPRGTARDLREETR